jgi:hypothetical protein
VRSTRSIVPRRRIGRPSGSCDRDVVVGAESHLGGEHHRTACDDELAVVAQPGEQIVEHAGAFVGPERRPTRATASLGALAHLVEERRECLVMVVGPAAGARLGECAVDHGPVEQVERGVVRRAPVARCDADLVARLLDRFDIEQVVVEVGVRACRPRFEAAG